jgi:hypothetical protein
MNLEEIKKLTDENLGMMLMNAVGFQESIGSIGGYPSKSWKRGDWEIFFPEDFCEDLDRISGMEKIVIGGTSMTDYGRCLVGVTECHGMSLESIALIATATARQRAEACYLVLLPPSPVTEVK